jgi:hypothetical protein
VGRRISIGVVVVLGVAGAAAPARAVSAANGGPAFSVRVVRSSRQDVLRARTLRVRVVARAYGRVRVSAVVRGGTTAQRPRGANLLVRAASFAVHGTRTVSLQLSAAGFRALRDCRRAPVLVTATAGRGRRARVRHAGLTYPRVRGGCHGGLVDVRGARRGTAFRVGAAVGDFSPPAFGHAPGGDPADCLPAGNAVYTGPRAFAFAEPYADSNGNGHYDPPDPTVPTAGEPFLDCNGNGRWDGNLIGGDGGGRYYDRVADPVGARAIVVSNARRTIAVEVVDQEGLFNTYIKRIRERVAADGYRLDGVFISATHDESAPDTLGINGQSATTSSVDAYFVDYLVARSAQAIEEAYRAMRPAYVRYAEAMEPANLRQCWSSYPYVDNQRMPAFQAVGTDGRTIATMASVSQHAETLAFNSGTPELDAQKLWLSSDWPHFFRSALEQRYGGVGIEMAGAVGSVETPQVFGGAVSRTPQHFVDAGHPAGCRTLFDAPGTAVPLGYDQETATLGRQLAGSVIGALDRGAMLSDSEEVWGARREVCIPFENALFTAAAAAGVFAERSAYTGNCSVEVPPAPNGSTSGNEVLSDVAAFGIGDGEFIALPGEVFPFTYFRSFLGAQDMPNPSFGLPAWPLPHMHAPYRFFNGLAEDMIGYIFPRGNAVGIPGLNDPTNPTGQGPDRFGCGHSDDSEAASSQAADLLGSALVGILDAHHGAAERIVTGRYVLGDGSRSRDPLGGPVVKCAVDQAYHPASPAVAVDVRGAGVVRPRAWLALDGRSQSAPDRDTRGYIARDGSRVWLDVFPD